MVESLNELMKKPGAPLPYNFIVGIDFGTFSTSFSFARVDDKEEIITVDDWPWTYKDAFGGRVPSACLYKHTDESPLWGGSADKRFYKRDYLFHTTNIKSYLTDAEYQNKNPLPEGLDPIKLAADYLRQVHERGVTKMKYYFESDKIVQSHDSQRDDNNTYHKVVEKSRVRYIISYPDNQGDEYKVKMKKAVELAGIISPGDPQERLAFITESEATAYSCTVDENIKYSNNTYIVCDIGRTTFGISTIKSSELAGTERVEAIIDVPRGECGSINLDKCMREYLEKKIFASDKNDLYLLELIRERLFKFYVDTIKFTYDGNNDKNFYCNMPDIDMTGSSIQSECFEENTFIFSSQDLGEKVFGPVVYQILANIQMAVYTCEERISGIFISSTIGHCDYLSRIVNDKFGTEDIIVAPLKESQFVTSRGLVIFGFRERGRMIPYFGKKFKDQRDGVKHVIQRANDEVNTIDFSSVDYIVGLDFGSAYSKFAYAKARYYNDPTVSHPHVIQNAGFSKQKGNQYNFSKTSPMLYFDDQMKYLGRSGEEEKHQSQLSKSEGILLRHFKLLSSKSLDPVSDDETLNILEDFQVNDPPRYYFRVVREELINRLMRNEIIDDRSFSKLNIGYVITTPGVYSDDDKIAIRIAIEESQLVKKEDIDTRVHFITEAKAAAMYCKRFYSGDFSMELGQKFMICDAGEGAVKLTTLKVFQKENGQQYISELTSGARGNCSSVFLDKAFEDYIVKKFDEYNIRKIQSGIRELVQYFIRNIKPYFDNEVEADHEDDFFIAVPIECEIYDIEGIPGFIEDDYIIVPYIDIENYVFKPVVDDVLKLIDNQLNKLDEEHSCLDAILLIGGFGGSGYLYTKIRDAFEGKVVGARFIGRPPDEQLAICKGAVSFALQPKLS